MGEYEDHPCPDCGGSLVQLDGDWLCEECDNLSEFTTTGQDYDFVV